MSDWKHCFCNENVFPKHAWECEEERGRVGEQSESKLIINWIESELISVHGGSGGKCNLNTLEIAKASVILLCFNMQF